MSKYGKYIIAILLGIVLAISAWHMVFSRDVGDKLSPVHSDEKLEKIDLTISLDRDEYFSSDTAKLQAKIKSNVKSGKLMVLAEGMQNNYGKNYFAEKKIIELEKDSESIIEIEKQLPECSTCSGFSEGKYEIVVSAMRGSYVLAKDKIVFNFAE